MWVMSIDKIKASRAIRKAKPLGRYALGGEPEPPMVPGGATANLDLPKEDRVTAAMREGWGEGDLGLSEESRRWLIEHGVYPSSAKDPSLLKRINRGVIESIEPVGEAALRGSNAVLHGVANVAGGYYDKLPLPSFIRNNLGTGAQLERDLVDMPNAFMASVPGGYIDAVNTTKSARGLERAGLRAGERGGINLGPKGDVLGIGVIPETSKPLTVKVLHGTPERGVKSIDPKKANEVLDSSWFTDNPDVAHQYRFEREYGEMVGNKPGDLLEAEVTMKNPLVVDRGGDVGDAMYLSKLADQAKKNGHDGLVIKNVDDSIDSSRLMGTSYAAFDKGQLNIISRNGKPTAAPAPSPVSSAQAERVDSKNVLDFDARLAAKEEAEDRPFMDYGSRLQGESLANTQIKATPYKDEEIKRFLHPDIFDNPKIDHYKLGQYTGAVKSWLEHPNAQQFVNMPDQMIDNYVNSMKKAENRLFNDGDLSQNVIDRTRRNSKVRKEAISLREQYNQMRDRIGLQPWDTVKSDDAYTGHKAGDIDTWAWSQGWDYAKKAVANMAEKSVTSNDLINMTAMARKIPKPITKSHGGAVHQRALGAKLFGLK